MKTLVLLAAIAVAAPRAFGEEGLASWYGGKFHGRLTSSGEVFDTNEMTAAHRTLPFGTMVKVTNLDNGKSAIVKINDRGPFVRGRVIDLSRAAAAALGMVDTGVARVSVQIESFVSPIELFAIQVGAYGTEANARRVQARLEHDGFVVTTEKTSLGITRVLLRALSTQAVEDARRKLVKLGYANYLVRKEKTEQPPAAQEAAALRRP